MTTVDYVVQDPPNEEADQCTAMASNFVEAEEVLELIKRVELTGGTEVGGGARGV